jgi:hypothetical protein
MIRSTHAHVLEGKLEARAPAIPRMITEKVIDSEPRTIFVLNHPLLDTTLLFAAIGC